MRSFSKPIFTLSLCTAILATATFAASHQAKSNNAAVAARHAQMQMIAYNIGVLGNIAKGEAEFDAAMVNSAAANMSALAKMDPASLWLPGTEQGAADGSRAKAEIWSDADGFAAKFNDLAIAADALAGAADAGAVGASMAALGGACKACHEGYRGPKN